MPYQVLFCDQKAMGSTGLKGERQGHKMLAEQRVGLQKGGAAGGWGSGAGPGWAGQENLQASDRLQFASKGCGHLPSHRPTSH